MTEKTCESSTPYSDINTSSWGLRVDEVEELLDKLTHDPVKRNECWVKILSTKPRKLDNVRGYIFTMCRNHLIGLSRRKRHRKISFTDYAVQHHMVTGTCDGSIYKAIIEGVGCEPHQARYLAEQIDVLPEDKDIICLRIRGYTYRKIAEKLGYSVKRVFEAVKRTRYKDKQ